MSDSKKRKLEGMPAAHQSAGGGKGERASETIEAKVSTLSTSSVRWRTYSLI